MTCFYSPFELLVFNLIILLSGIGIGWVLYGLKNIKITDKTGGEE